MNTFADLPDALVRDLLAKAIPVATAVSNNLDQLASLRAPLRSEAQASGLICRKADLDVPREPSVVGIDGSYQVHHLTALDLCASAAVAVEGTTKEAKRFWPQPYHEMWVDSISHEIDTVGVLRGMMISMELNLAHKAPHDVVMMDGSFTSLVIYLNQGLQNLASCGQGLCLEFLTRWNSGILQGLLALLKSDRTVAIPKFTSRNELLRNRATKLPVQVDGKTLATLLLEAGEYTKCLPVLEATEKYHLLTETNVDGAKVSLCKDSDVSDMNIALHNLSVVYFRPYGWLPALRLELPGPVSKSKTKLSLILEGVQRQLFSPAVMEPYPLFLADRMVKSLGAGVTVIEQSVAQHVVARSTDIETTMLCLQNYRTEGGRGGA
jgi:NurA domain